jgi:hypothetical protein
LRYFQRLAWAFKLAIDAGFLVATELIWLFNITALFIGGGAWLALLYLLVLLIPASSLTYLKLKNPKQKMEPQDSAKWRNLLSSFQGVALAFWLFDIMTTFYAINVTGLTVELNLLGSPLGILGALAYYASTLVFLYVLLFKMKEGISFHATIPLTLITLGMGAMNWVAGAQNFQVFVDTTALATGIRYRLLAFVVTVNFTVPFALKRVVTQPKSVLS